MPDPKPEGEPDIADASLLFGSEPSESKPQPAKPETPSEPGDGYSIEDVEEPVTRRPMSVPPPSDEPRTKPSRSSRAADSDDDIATRPRRASRSSASPSDAVEQVWSRWAEWGGSLVRFGIGLVVAGYLLYATFTFSAIMLWLGVLLVCVVGLTILAYPLLITLERPVRMTPEQALKDFFGAFSHLVPHTRRMWLLLARGGRTSPDYKDFVEFNAYWKNRVNTWKSEVKNGGMLNPFDIELVDFKAEKSAGQTEIEAKYSARVIERDGSHKVVLTYGGTIRAVRGEDKMWYLDGEPLP